MGAVYKDLYAKEAALSAVHAGLECSTIGAKYPNLDLISIGPTLKDVHSPDEKMYIPSVKRVVDLLAGTLKRIPEK